MVRGILDTTWIDFPPNIDQTYVQNLTTPRGVNFQRVLTLIDQRLAAAASLADPVVAAIASYTTSSLADDSTPTAFDLEEENEYGLPRPDMSERRAHMLPFRRYAKALGFTEQGLEEATEAEIIRQIDNMLLTFTRGQKLKVLERLFSNAEVYVDRNSTATSPGMAGSGTGDNVFSGTYPDGTDLPNNYTHYWRDTTANRKAVIDGMIADMKLWHPGPYDIIGSASEITAITGLDGFTNAGSQLVLPGSGTAQAQVDRDQYVGVYTGPGGADVRIWQPILELGSQANFALFKTYGNFDARNPVVIRYDDRFGRGIEVRYRSFYPLDGAFMRQRYGAGVQNRVGAHLATIAASGSYVNPTLS